MIRHLGITVLFVALLGCGVSPRRGGYGVGGGVEGGGGGGGTAVGGGGPAPVTSGDPRTILNQVDQYLQQQGYARVGPAVRNANLPANGVIAYAIDARPGVCNTVVAIAQQGADLNMVILDPGGGTIGYNVDPDPYPWVTVCPTAQGRHIARLQMASGGGEYYYAVYQGSPQQRPSLAALFGGQQEQGAQQAQLDPTTAQRLAALDQRLATDRFQRQGDPQGVVHRTGEDRNFELNLQQGYCYAFATLGGPGTRDTDVFLVDGGGNEIERDVSTEIDALVRYCPSQSGTYSLRSRLYAGQGPVFTAGYVQQSGGQPAEQVGPVIANQSTAGAGVDENFRLIDADMRARGYEPYGQPARGELTEGQTRDFEISLEGGKCYAIQGVGDNGVRDLDLILLGSDGSQIDRDVETDARPAVRVCAPTTGGYRMQVRMFRGQGSFVYAPYRWPRGTRGPFGLEGLIYVRLAEVTSLLAVEGFEPDVDSAPGRGALAREGQSRSQNLNLAANQCYAVLVVGGEGVNNLDVTLAQGSNQVAREETRTAFPSVRHCTQQAGRFSLNVQATAGSGQYFYQIFRRSSGR